MKDRLPDFLIIGAMKCGTTSLHHYLSKHPDIFMTKKKEIHFFQKNIFEKYDLKWYKNQFISDKKIAGTSPQSYTKRHLSTSSDIPSRLKKYLPNIKLIYIVRDPIERIQSHIYENIEAGQYNYFYDFDNAILNDIVNNHYVQTSKYDYQLEPYRDLFGQEKLYILTLEDLIANPLKELNNLFEFLNVPQLNEADFDLRVYNRKESKTRITSFGARINYISSKSNWIKPILPENLLNVLRKNYHTFLSSKTNKIFYKRLNHNTLREIKSQLEPDISQFCYTYNISNANWSLYNSVQSHT